LFTSLISIYFFLYLLGRFCHRWPSRSPGMYTQSGGPYCLRRDGGNHLEEYRQVNADRKCRLMKCLFLQSPSIGRRSRAIQRRLTVRNTSRTRSCWCRTARCISNCGVQSAVYGLAGQDYSGSAVTDWTNRLIATISCQVSKAETEEWLRDEMGMMPHSDFDGVDSSFADDRIRIDEPYA